MKVKGPTGRVYHLKVSDYLIDWTRKVSGPQKRVKDFLRPYWQTSVCTEETCIPGTRMRIDLINWNRRLVVEVSPSSSHSFNAWMHKDRPRFGAAVGRDIAKREWAEANGFTFVSLDDADIAQLSPAWFKATYGIEL